MNLRTFIRIPVGQASWPVQLLRMFSPSGGTHLETATNLRDVAEDRPGGLSYSRMSMRPL